MRMRRLPGRRYKMFNSNPPWPGRCFDLNLYTNFLAIAWGYSETDDENEMLALQMRGFLPVSGPPSDWQGWGTYEKPVEVKNTATNEGVKELEPELKSEVGRVRVRQPAPAE